MTTTEPTVAPEPEMPKKPILISLQPVVESLLPELTTLVDTLSSNNQSTSIINTEILNGSIPKIISQSPLSMDGADNYQKIVLEVVMLRVLSTVIAQAYEDELVNYDQLSTKVFVILDIAIHLAAISKDSDIDLPFLVIHNMVLKTDKTFILQHFQKKFFSMESEERKDYLINHCGVSSLTKRPGTEIIDIYEDITRIFDLTSDDNLKLIANFRLFISECFNIDEMALNNPNYKINTHFDGDKEVYQSVKKSGNSNFNLYAKVRYQLTYPETMFNERYLPRDCTNAITDLLNAIIDANSKEKNRTVKNGLEIRAKTDNELELEQLKELLENFTFAPSLVLTEPEFNDMFKTKIFRYYLTIQISMLVNHLLSYWDSAAFHKPFFVRTDVRKTKDFCINIKKKLQIHYKEYDEHFFHTMNIICHDSNHMWVQWKSNNFKIVKDTAIEDERINKAKELVLKNSKMRPKHIPKMGTNEISRIWKLETGLNQLTAKTDESQFDNLREELQKLEKVISVIDEDPDMFTASEIAYLKGKKEMLTFKALRLHRDKGNWLSFSNTNYKFGVEGLFDPSLKTQFDQDQILLRKTELENDLKIKDEEGDIVMSIDSTPKVETKTEEEDLDY